MVVTVVGRPTGKKSTEYRQQRGALKSRRPNSGFIALPRKLYVMWTRPPNVPLALLRGFCYSQNQSCEATECTPGNQSERQCAHESGCFPSELLQSARRSSKSAQAAPAGTILVRAHCAPVQRRREVSPAVARAKLLPCTSSRWRAAPAAASDGRAFCCSCWYLRIVQSKT